ncbi:MAG: 4-hydroxy-3-methylbut-2-enyl diphosphate reductase [Thermoanaerobacteraceae bacterium]|nr:4-hydroxy-3-methylbut-2-enyl diphosphate reductase [Thermoanaerobacteraceae bacterium]
MNIIIADNSGFCFGVNRAINAIYNEIEKGKKIYSWGPLIHNPEVINDLVSKGVQITENIDDFKSNDKVLIRTHGIPKDVFYALKEKDVAIIDMTCPFVKKVQHIANKYYNEGYKIIIIGDKTHPEVIGVNGWVDNSAIILETADDAKELPFMDKACIVTQTTLKKETFDKIVNILNKKVKNIKVFNTICNATKDRQESAYKLSQLVDIMIVIGGYNSSNTKKLYDICKENCNNTFLVETKHDLPEIDFNNYNNIGITAGASTPNWIIKDVVETIMNLNNKT